MSKKKRIPKFLRTMDAKRQQAWSTTESVVAPTETTLRDEVSYVCRLASEGESHVIGFNQLVFFSTATGDAWMLDWEDELAICLMKDGVQRPFRVGETVRQFAIQWQGRYHVEGEVFSYIDNENPTHARAFIGYPTDAISATITRLRHSI